MSLRGAVSIARRLQDPLAELVKIDPKSIGVGQYQHDLAEYKLSRSLDAVVEDCVNAVGVDLNTASAPLLARVSGLGDWVAQNIVDPSRCQRPVQDAQGADQGRRASAQRPSSRRRASCASRTATIRSMPPAFTRKPIRWCAAFIEATKSDIKVVIGNGAVLKKLKPESFTDEKFGVPTVKDILSELEKPGRDPRPEFKTATFMEGVEKIGDLKPGMMLEGVVTNVAAFGAFVDIGVHQDGLVHISALADTFVKDPRNVVKPGDVVKVKVLEVDMPRKRIALTMRMSDPAEKRPAARQDDNRAAFQKHRAQAERKPAAPATSGGALADALRRAGMDKGGRK